MKPLLFHKLTQRYLPVNDERFACACRFGTRKYRPVSPYDIDAHAALVLAPGLFVVKGAKHHALYDLGKGRLYSLDDAALDALFLIAEDVDAARKDPAANELLAKLEAEELYHNGFVACELPQAEKRNTSLNFALIQVTDLCNLKCIHCYEDAKYDSKDFHTLSYEDARYVMDELCALGVKNIQFTGGEPLCNKEIKEIVRYGVEHFETVEFYTNCIALGEEFAAFLKENGVTVATSIYSYDAVDHSFVTLRRTSHERSVAAIKLLQKYDIPYRISTILLNGADIGERGDADYDLTQFQDTVRLVGRANAGILDDVTLDKKIISENTFADKLDTEDVLFSLDHHGCFGYLCYISAELEVNACPMEKRLHHGNLSAKTPGLLAEILNQDIINMTYDKIETCKDCELRYACSDCRADNMERPTNAKPWYCSYDPYTATWDSDAIHENIKMLKETVYQELKGSGE